MIVGVTGTRKGWTQPQRKTLQRVTSELSEPIREAHHGDCIGVDEQFAWLMREEHGAWIVGHPPTDPKYRAFFPSDETRPERPYLERDRDVVLESALMLALPKGAKEERRSGTWATIRIAWKLWRPLTIIYPDGGDKSYNLTCSGCAMPMGTLSHGWGECS